MKAHLREFSCSSRRAAVAAACALGALDSLALAAGAETRREQFEWAGLPSGWLQLLLFLAAGAICFLAVWLYHREKRAGASRLVRMILAGLRCLVLGGLLLIWLEPVIATYVSRTLAARVPVLVDVSASMTIADAPPGEPGAALDAAARPTRRQQAAALLSADDQRWLKRLAARNEVVLYGFGEGTAAVRLPWDQTAPPAASHPASRPAGDTVESFAYVTDGRAPSGRTDVGQALARAIEDAGDAPLAGIVVISDGGLNKGMDADEIVAYARRFKARLFTVGVGEPVEPPNLRVADMTAPPTVPKGDPFEIRAEVAAAGLPEQEVSVELTSTPADAGPDAEETVLERRGVTLAEGASAPVLFQVSPTVAGEFVYRVRLAALPQEAVLHDNVREATVIVLDDRLRVLVVAGRPNYDYRAVARLLERDNSVNVACWLQSADQRAIRDGDIQLTELPRKPEEIFAYDAILLMDASATDLDASWATLLRRFVDEFGGGVLVQSGPQFGPRLLADPKMVDLVGILPISPDPEAEIRLGERGTYRTSALPIAPADDALAHPLVAFSPDPARCKEIWNALPGPWWFMPVYREKPVASVLLRIGAGPPGQAGAPLLAVQPVGAGRTAFLAFDSTWRWRATADRYFNRFWIQVVRYLAQARRQGASKRGAITLDRDVISVGDYVKIEARVLDERFNPWHESSIDCEITMGDGAERRVALEAIPGREGWFAGRALFDVDGPAVLRVPLPGAAPATQPADAALIRRVRVQRPDVEMRALRLRDELLEQIANETHGRYLPIAEAGSLPDRIQNASRTEPPRPIGVQSLWDQGWVLGVLATLLAAEWTIRRRNHLL